MKGRVSNPFDPPMAPAMLDKPLEEALPVWRYLPAAPSFLAGVLLSGVGVGLLLRMLEFFQRGAAPSTVESFFVGGLLLAAGAVWLWSANMFMRARWRPAIAWALAVPMGLIGLLAFSVLYHLLTIWYF